MKSALTRMAWLPLFIGQVALAQAVPTAPAVEDFKPATTNQLGKQYPMVNSERRIRERIVAAQAQKVELDISAVRCPLTKGADGAWIGDSAPQDEGFHYYQIWVDGAAVPDPNSTYFYGASRWGSGIEIPAKDQDFYALKDVPHGQLRSVLFFSKSTNATQHCFVYTPPDYDQDPSKRFPVMYLQHGSGEDENGWASQGHANLIMDNLIAEGKAKPFIIVIGNSNVGGGGGRGGAPGGRGGMPARGPGALGPVLNQEGLSLVAAPVAPGGAPGVGGRAGGIAGRGGRGGGMNFGPFQTVLLDEMIPYIDANFRTFADQPHRGMAGLSMGGMQTKSITLSHVDTFSQIGIFSGGTITPADITDMASYKQRVKVVFMSYGSKESNAPRGGGTTPAGAQGAKIAADELTQAGIKSVTYTSPETAHEWQSWRRSLHEFAPLAFQN